MKIPRAVKNIKNSKTANKPKQTQVINSWEKFQGSAKILKNYKKIYL